MPVPKSRQVCQLPHRGAESNPPLKGLAGVAVLDGVQLLNAKLRTAHRAGGVSGGMQNTIMETQGEFVPAPLASPGGVAERSESFNNNDCRWQSYLDPIAGTFSGSSEPMKVTEEGRRQPKCCLHPVQWYQPKIIADYISLFKFIYHIENGSYKTSALLHSLNPLRNFWCTPSLISHAPYGARQLPPGGSQGGLYEFARALIKP